MFPPHKFTAFKSTEKTTTEVMVLYSLLIINFFLTLSTTHLGELLLLLNEKKIVAALENNAFSDFEDGLQEECAVESMADYIVTRNPADFKHSSQKSEISHINFSEEIFFFLYKNTFIHFISNPNSPTDRSN